MKTLFVVLLCSLIGAWLGLLAQAPMKPTRVSDASVAAPPTSFTAIWIVTPQGKVLVQPDASIQIDLTATPPVIRAVAPPAPEVWEQQVDRWVAESGQTVFTMTAERQAGTHPMVFRNGLLQLPGADYMLSGQDVTFVAIGPGDYVQMIYRK